MTSWAIFEAIKLAGYKVSLNDVCVLLPAGFGAVARCAPLEGVGAGRVWDQRGLE